jgi:alanine dehydrogenase
MLYILLVIGIALIIWGVILDDSYADGNGVIILGGTIGVPSLVVLLLAGGVYNYDSSTIDSRLAVLEEQNTTVLTQVEPLVQQALNYESSTYKDLKLDVNKLIIFAQMYPELKANSFLNKQIDIILHNQEEIKQLKLDKATLNAYHFWLWTPKVD